MRYTTKKKRISIIIAIIFCSILVTVKTSAQNNYKPGKSFKDCPDCPEMIVIPSGIFTMGTPDNEEGRSEVEGPVKKITINQFAAGKYDITRGQWELFVNATHRPVITGCAFSGFEDTSRKDWDANPSASWQHLGFPQDMTHPAVCLT